MIRKVHFLWIGLGLLLVACGQNVSKSTTDKEVVEAETSSSEHQFGEVVEADGAISYADLLEQMEHSDSVKVKVKGKVEAVCQAKGCWMNIMADRPEAEDMMVKFKDYGFFVPKDIAGQEVIMEGKAYREVTPVDELRHLAQDAGKPQEEIEKITEPKVELKFMASGVLLLDAK